MSFKIQISLLLHLICVCFGDQLPNTGIIFHYNNTYQFNKVYTVYVSRNSEYIMEFDGDLESYDTPARVTVASASANKTYPLFITARQQKGVFSWQLPALVQTPAGGEQFASISRTLCPHNNLFDELRETCDAPSQNTPIIHLTSSSPAAVEVVISVATIPDFYIKHNVTTNATITPSEPQYYFYPFKQDVDLDLQTVRRKHICNEKLGVSEQSRLRSYMLTRPQPARDWLWRPKSVIVMIESDDDLCAVVSIQNFSCPVFDNERDILYDGYYFTMTRRGGITLTQDKFPLGFYIVFIVKSSDDDCVASTNGTGGGDRVKSFSFRIVETISYQEYLIAASAALAFFLAFYVGFGLVVVCRRTVSTDGAGPVRVEAACATGAGDADENTDTSSEASTTDTQPLCLAHLSRQTAGVLAARSSHYAYHALTLAVFYTLPVAQLALTYQILVNQSGNGDLCYLNLLCARPLYKLSDFNHVYSNLGYALLGALFLLVVWRRQRMHRLKTVTQLQLGIPPHFGLLYALGLSLVSEGILSASYHVCPNSMNFQFDTSFMYVTGVLCMIKIYQSRHPDINARAHATFGVLALIIFIGVVGILNPNLYFWVAFTAVHLTTCFVLTFQIYYMGRLRLDGGTVSRAARSLLARPLRAVTPTHAGRCVLLLLANLANWALAAYGVSQHSRDFGSHLLSVVMTNLFLYTLFYIVMKLLHREAIRWYSWVFITLAYSTWFSSSYFYLDQSTNWALTPAQSRLSNKVCSLLQFYDSHDIWHFMSAMAMFFSFNMYLTIDDNLSKTPRDKIMVF